MWRERSFILRGIVCLLPTAFSLPVAAKDAADEDRVHKLDTIEAIANPAVEMGDTGDVVLDEHTGAVQRIDRTVFDRADVDLGNVLDRQPGAQARQIGGFGTFSSLTVRAGTPAQTDVYLDGVRLNRGANPVIDLATLELLNLGSIELYRGTAPLQLGHGNIGGAVNLRSLDLAEEGSTRLQLGLGSFSSRRAQLTHGRRFGPWGVTAALSHLHSDNDFKFVDGNGTPLNPDDDERQRRNNAQARRQALMTRVSRRWSNGNQSVALLQWSDRTLGVPEWRNSPDNRAGFDTRVAQFQLSQTMNGVGAWDARHGMFVHDNASRYDDRLGQVGLGKQDIHSQSNTYGVSSYWERIGDRGTLAFSGELSQNPYKAKNRLKVNDPVDASREHLSAVAHYVWLSDQERWTVTPAIRLSLIRDRIRRSPGRATSLRGSEARVSVGPQLGFLHRYRPGLRLRGNLGKHDREPSFSELYASQGLVNGNPDLTAESGYNADVGITHENWRSWTFDASLFYSLRRDLIVTVYDSRGIGRAENIGKARVVGLELDAVRPLGKRFTVRTNLTVQDAINVSDDFGTRDRQLPGEARLSAHARLDYSSDPWQLWIEGDLKRDRFYDSDNLLPAKDSDIVSAGLNWKTSRWQVELTMNNLTDRNVEDFNGFPRPGRAFFLGVRTELR